MYRVYSIDYLRGILALLIMSYHYFNWEKYFIPNSSSFLTRNAIYGVSLFFIISGFSLTINYLSTFNNFNLKKIMSFWLKRFARIYPLFWLITIAYLSLVIISGKSVPSISHIVSNLTISFSFYNDYTSFTAGGWSIGVEIVLYCLFPFALLFVRKSRAFGIFVFILFILISMYVSSYFIYDIADAKDFWNKYLYLINHIYFFIFGILTGIIYTKYNKLFMAKKRLIEILFIIILLVFVYYPIDGEVIKLLIKENRIILTILIFIFFILVVMYNSYINYKSELSRIFNFFGDISYTLYLIHPIVYMIINYFFSTNNVIKIISMLFITILTSAIIHKWYEMVIQAKILDWMKKYV